MTVTSAIDTTRDWLLVTMTGKVTFEAIRAHLTEERARRELGYRELIDATDATVDLSPGQVREIVAMLRDLGKTDALGPTAIVVASDYTFGMMRMLEILLDDAPVVRPFRSRPEAEIWLAHAPTLPPTDRPGQGAA